ncbi:MAG: FHA domain-containing protein [Deltaproteobacteria bacterium]|nr:FHA domain-containing protein [Deltaproteobacteria bacterium]
MTNPKDPFGKPAAAVAADDNDDPFAGLDGLDNFSEGKEAGPDQETTSLVSMEGVEDGAADPAIAADIARAKEVGVSLASSTIEPLPESPRAVIDFAAGDRPSIPVSKSVFVIGRGKEVADIVLAGEKVSRHHAAIIFASGEFFIEDLHSTNGTFVAGKRVTRVRLEAGVQVTIGGHTMTLRWEH